MLTKIIIIVYAKRLLFFAFSAYGTQPLVDHFPKVDFFQTLLNIGMEGEDTAPFLGVKIEEFF